MVFRSPLPQTIGWGPPLVAFITALFLPALIGGAVLYFGNTPVAGLPKDGSARDFVSHVTLIAAAVTAAPLIGWVALPIAVPLLRLSVLHGWAGPGTAALAAVLVGLPIVHVLLNADVTTEDSAVLAHIIAALILQGLVAWAVLRLFRKTASSAPDA